jgi:hypothetical protein
MSSVAHAHLDNTLVLIALKKSTDDYSDSEFAKVDRFSHSEATVWSGE